MEVVRPEKQAALDPLRGPRAWPLLDHLPHLAWNLALTRGSIVAALERVFRVYGKKTISLRLGPLTVVATADLGQARRVLVDEVHRHRKTFMEADVLEPAMERGLIVLDGDEWERHHRAVAPTFRPSAMPLLVQAVRGTASSRMDGWQATVDVGHEMRCIAIGFALIEARSILVEILRRFELSLDEPERVSRLVASILTRPRAPVTARVKTLQPM